MIEEVATIVGIEQVADIQHIVVETQIKTTCSSCQAQSNCGTSTVAKAFSNKTQQLSLVYSGPVVLGQKIKIGIPEERLLSASLLVYLMPLVGLICGALLASFIFPLFSLNSELWVVAAAFTVATGVFLAVKHYLNGVNQSHFCPQLLEVLADKQTTISIKQL